MGQPIALLSICLNWKISLSLQLFSIALGTVSSLRVSYYISVTHEYQQICLGWTVQILLHHELLEMP
jgi:hypothetical protein